MNSFFLILGIMFWPLAINSQRPYSRCRCMPDTPCWPTAQEWNGLNASLSGRLVQPQPSGYPCYRGAGYNITACSQMKTSRSNAYYRRDLPGTTQSENWEEAGENGRCALETADGRFAVCHRGRVSVYGVQVESVKDVQTAVKFAASHNLRLVVKSTGHDYMGRSSAAGSFLIWMQKMKGITYSSAFVPKNCPREPATPAVTVTGGTGWGEVYDYVEQNFGNKLVILGGNAATVGAAGGFALGGGHGAQSPWLGLAVDNVLELQVVTADGQLRTLNKCQEPDLFWALRGGGGGTFGVVTAVTHKLNPGAAEYTSYAVVAFSSDFQPLTGEQMEALLEVWASYTPILEEVPWGGYFQFVTGIGFFISILAPLNEAAASQTVVPLTNGLLALQTKGITIVGVNQTNPEQYTRPFKSFRQWHSWTGRLFSPETGTDATGGRTILGSRLVPVSALSNPRLFAKTIVDGMRANGLLWGMLGHFVNGKGVRARDPHGTETSVTPAWRRSVYHVVMFIGWSYETTDAELANLTNALNAGVQVWRDAYPGAGAYGNEAFTAEPRWQEAFWGAENYGRLYRIKMAVDPAGLFTCPQCVGCEMWDAEGVCQK
ncbi:uncharacterized protein LOC129583005 [Paramacrobiotus metropolitanus]|uniref:uncharacterized protein LOC129583005 n=1 Tax=Paramacrobiotus metropolitanus TaxID=2943436 RepID=UPI002445D59B|nr:uncharacterized protein LOC129583005 [Paramacrobiotus metropolitanus]